MVDELTTCWAMVSFRKCCSLSREMDVSVPLYYGSLYEPQVRGWHAPLGFHTCQLCSRDP